MERNCYGDFDPYAVSRIRYAANRLAHSHGFCPHEVQDLEQELALDLNERLPSYDANRASLETFITRLVQRKAINLMVERRAQKRGGGTRAVSLDELLGRKGCHRADGASDDDVGDPGRDGLPCDGLPCDGLPSASREDRLNLRLDLERAFRSLPADMRELCVDLLTESVSEVARSEGRSRSSVYDRIQRLREALRDLAPGNRHERSDRSERDSVRSR